MSVVPERAGESRAVGLDSLLVPLSKSLFEAVGGLEAVLRIISKLCQVGQQDPSYFSTSTYGDWRWGILIDEGLSLRKCQGGRGSWHMRAGVLPRWGLTCGLHLPFAKDAPPGRECVGCLAEWRCGSPFGRINSFHANRRGPRPLGELPSG